MKRNEELLKVVKLLVRDEASALDVETGICRFCDQIIEAASSGEIEGHLKSCPWRKTKELVGAA